MRLPSYHTEGEAVVSETGRGVLAVISLGLGTLGNVPSWLSHTHRRVKARQVCSCLTTRAGCVFRAQL